MTSSRRQRSLRRSARVPLVPSEPHGCLPAGPRAAPRRKACDIRPEHPSFRRRRGRTGPPRADPGLTSTDLPEPVSRNPVSHRGREYPKKRCLDGRRHVRLPTPSLRRAPFLFSRGHQGPTAPAQGGQHPVSTSDCRKARSRKVFRAPSQRRQVAAHRNLRAFAGSSSLATLESVMAPPPQRENTADSEMRATPRITDRTPMSPRAASR